MEFESRLARRIARKKSQCKLATAAIVSVFAVFLVLNLPSASLAAPHATIQIGSKTSVAKYLGQFDGKSNVVMLGAISTSDWICVKVPLKGKLSDLKSIAFSEFVAQTGGIGTVEPYLVVELAKGGRLICDPVLSYADGAWDLPLMEWQLRDAASKGMWVYTTQYGKSSSAPLASWASAIGDKNALSLGMYIGRWDITSPFQCYIGDLSVNGRNIDLSNAARCSGTLADMPPGF